ncbi:MAG TPA: Lrp/AsnC family transcriptional regulator [Rectinemataceae bacterium]|nr:Lrp/AsnC family transcriptional regulator [Rectinemataceae bacterium]
MIDDTDRTILGLLQDNARLSNASLAEAVGMTASSVFERVKKLERRGVIVGYRAIVNAEKLGKPLLAFIRLTIGMEAHTEIDSVYGSVLEACLSEPDVLECHNVAGEDCYILKVRAEGPKQLENLLTTIRRKTRSSRSITNIVLSTYKDSSKVEPAPESQVDEEA